jgi:hypothetical protein
MSYGVIVGVLILWFGLWFELSGISDRLDELLEIFRTKYDA